MAIVEIDQVSKRYADAYALDEVSMTIGSGEFVTLLGPSGCGKSTTLRAIAGLTEVDRGNIRINGRDITRIAAHKRNVGMVFQNLALFPHMTVEQNVAFGLRMRGIRPSDGAARIAEALSLVKLGDFGKRYPRELSGGQQQRVAIARALVIEPEVLLLDEPFSALDRNLRIGMQAELRAITRKVGITSVFVTHDQEEALSLSDRIAVMNAGRVEQMDTPVAIFERPDTRFVADFMGMSNILEATVRSRRMGVVNLDWMGRPIQAPEEDGMLMAEGSRLTVAMRPEALRLSRRKGLDVNTLSGTVLTSVYQGSYVNYKVRLDLSDLIFSVRQSRDERTDEGVFAEGDDVVVQWSTEDVVVLRDYPRGETRKAAADAAPIQYPALQQAAMADGTGRH